MPRAFSPHPASDLLMVDLLDKLDNRLRSHIRSRRGRRLLLYWWRQRPLRCTTCYDGRLAKPGSCAGCARFYFVQARNKDFSSGG